MEDYLHYSCSSSWFLCRKVVKIPPFFRFVHAFSPRKWSKVCKGVAFSGMKDDLLFFSEVVSSTSEVVLFFSEVNETTSERNPLRSDFASRARTRAYTTCKTLFFAFTAFTQIHNPLSMRGLLVKGNPVKEVKDGRPFAFTRNPLYMRHLQPR